MEFLTLLWLPFLAPPFYNPARLVGKNWSKSVQQGQHCAALSLLLHQPKDLHDPVLHLVGLLLVKTRSTVQPPLHVNEQLVHGAAHPKLGQVELFQQVRHVQHHGAEP